MIRILYLIDKLVPAGTQKNLLEIVRNLNREEFEPHVIALVEGGDLLIGFENAGVKPLVLNTKRIYGWTALKTVFFLAHYIRKNKIDILQSFFLHGDVLGTLAGRLSGVRKIIHTRRDEGFWRGHLQLAINRFFTRFSDWVMVNSEAVKSAVLRDERVSLEKMHRIYNGIDIQEHHPSEKLRENSRRELGLKPNDIAIAVVANMRTPIKGHSYLLEAMPRVLKEHPEVKLVLVGDGKLRNFLEGYAVKLGVHANVIFAGVRNDISAIHNAADIACLPSLTEGFSNTLLEAMAAGKPMVATRVGGNPEAVVDQVTGFLVSAKDPDRLAEKLILLVENKTLRERMAEAAREHAVLNFSLSGMIMEYQKFYKKILGQTISPAPTAPAFKTIRSLRIAHLLWALEPGGAERHVVGLAQWQKRAGHDVSVICLTRKGPLAEELEKEGIHVDLIQKKIKIDFSIPSRIRRFLRSHHIDILHTHMPTASLWGRLAAMRVKAVKVIVSEHSDLAVQDWRYRLLNRILAWKTDRYLLVSGYIRDLMARHGIAASKMTVIHNGIELSDRSLINGRSSLRDELHVADGEVLIGTVGRLEPRKDQKTFLRASRLIKDMYPASKFVLVGDGPSREELEKETETLGLKDSVFFTGTRGDVEKCLSGMDIFILSSLTEGTSLALLEAMVKEKPCVATAVGGNPEIIRHDYNGKLVPKENPEAIADEVLQLIQDKPLAENMGRLASKTVREHFTHEQMMIRMENLYQELTVETER